MTDVLMTVVATMAAGFWGAAGGFIYWALPERPSGKTEFLKRMGAGFVAGSIANVFWGIQPFDATSAWDTAGVARLIGAGFAGLATIASFFQRELNQNYRALHEENLRLTGAGAPPQP